jgi:hypothetical protein
LLVNNAKLELAATPGQVYVHKMQVGIGATSPAMDVQVTVNGFGQTPDGAFQPLPPEQDHNPTSARSFITQIDKPSFHLEPGTAVPLAATITVPPDVGNHAYYATLYIHSTPIGQGGGVAQILAVVVPIVITPAGAQLNRTGTLADLQVGPVVAGKPIDIVATVQNTGNYHFKVKGEVTITGPAGQAVAVLPIELTTTSIIPSFTRALRVSYAALDQPKGLAPGTYTVAAKVAREDGELIGTRQTTFQVAGSYQVCPGTDDSHVLVKDFKNQDPGTIDARAQADVMITFEGTGNVTGQVAVCGYAQEPTINPRFSGDVQSGGTGNTGLKFASVRVSGFGEGVAHVAFHYNSQDLGAANPNSLFTAYLAQNFWRKLDNLVLQSGAQLVLGDMPVQAMKDGSYIAMAVDTASQPAVSTLPPAVLIAGIALGGVLILAIGFVIVRRTLRPQQKNNVPAKTK